MCGIVGIFGYRANEYKGALHKMMDSIIHRGRDGSGIYESLNGLCILGHRRLAILDLSDAAKQPMATNDNAFALVYNGMCYNFKELRDEILKEGNKLRSNGDAEVVFKILIKNGISVLSKINGMFALALWREKDKTLILARDRHGQKPLYFCQVGKITLFASEVKAILASGLISRKIDMEGMISYISYGSVYEPNTIISGVTAVKPGGYIALKISEKKKLYTFWSYEKSNKEESLAKIHSSFNDAVRRHLISDAPLGIFLSGGIDSSIITSYASKNTSNVIKTLSITFPEAPDISESFYAKLMAQKAGTDHHEIVFTGKNMLSELPVFINIIDQPSVDGLNTFIVSKAASRIGLKVALSGLGGDELFGGYPSFRDVPNMVHMKPIVEKMKKPIVGILTKFDSFSRYDTKIIEYLTAAPGLVNMYLARRRIFSFNQIKKLFSGFDDKAWEAGISTSLYNDLEQCVKKKDIYDAVGILEMKSYMGQTLLKDADTMGMANSIEIRLPFLDSDFSQLSLNLSPNFRKYTKKPKKYFVEIVGNSIPKAIALRPKQGFNLPIDKWMSHLLKKEIQLTLADIHNSINIIRKDSVSEISEGFYHNHRKIGWIKPWSLYILGRYIDINKLSL